MVLIKKISTSQCEFEHRIFLRISFQFTTIWKCTNHYPKIFRNIRENSDVCSRIHIQTVCIRDIRCRTAQLSNVFVSKFTKFVYRFLQEEIENFKTFDSCQNTDVLQRIWAKALNHVYKRDTESFETVAQFVLQHTESMLFGVKCFSISSWRFKNKNFFFLVQFNWSTVPSQDVQQIEENITQWISSLTSPILRDKCQHILDHIHTPHSHPILNKLKREKLAKDWFEDGKFQWFCCCRIRIGW